MSRDPVDRPRFGDTPGFAKALAELKKQVGDGEDPLYRKLDTQANGIAAPNAQPAPPFLDAPVGRAGGSDPATNALTTTVGPRVRRGWSPWVAWASGTLTAALILVVFTLGLRLVRRPVGAASSGTGLAPSSEVNAAQPNPPLSAFAPEPVSSFSPEPLSSGRDPMTLPRSVGSPHVAAPRRVESSVPPRSNNSATSAGPRPALLVPTLNE